MAHTMAVKSSTAMVWAMKGSYASEVVTVGVGTECPVVLQDPLVLLEPAFSIALSWGQEPRDLDAHLFIPMNWQIEGESYRLKEAKERSEKRRKQRAARNRKSRSKPSTDL